MNDYIKREAAIALITSRYECPEICAAEIKAIPAADVAPVIHGHIVWRTRHRGSINKRTCLKGLYECCDHEAIVDDRYITKEPYCSECSKILGDYMSFCGNCGARLDGEEENA